MLKRHAILMVALLGMTEPAIAQNRPAGNLSLAIVMVDELPFKQAKAVVIRRKDMRPQNVVLVTSQTTPSDLARAMNALATSRRGKGDVITQDLVAPIAAGRPNARSKDQIQSSKDLAALRSAPQRFIEGVGPRPVVFAHLRPPPGKQGRR